MSESHQLAITQESAAPVHADGEQPKYKRLTHHQLGIVLALREEGKTQAQIAEVLGCHQTAISVALKRMGVDTTRLAKHAAKASSYRAVRRLDAVVRKGADDDAIKAAGKLLDVAELTNTGANTQVAVQVVIGAPGQPAGPDPFDSLSITADRVG